MIKSHLMGPSGPYEGSVASDSEWAKIAQFEADGEIVAMALQLVSGTITNVRLTKRVGKEGDIEMVVAEDDDFDTISHTLIEINSESAAESSHELSSPGDYLGFTYAGKAETLYLYVKGTADFKVSFNI